MINIIFIYLCFWVFISSCFIRWVVSLNFQPEEDHKEVKEKQERNRKSLFRKSGITYDGIPYSEFSELPEEERYRIAYNNMNQKTHS